MKFIPFTPFPNKDIKNWDHFSCVIVAFFIASDTIISRWEAGYLVALIARDSFKEQPLEPVEDVSNKFNISEKRSFL